MTVGKIDELSWNCLRPRPEIPQAVLDSIPSEDMQSFVQLVAINPLAMRTTDVMHQKLRSFQRWRVETRSLKPKTAATERTGTKRVREEPEYYPPFEIDLPEYDEEEQPRRKQRRSTVRPSLAVESPPPLHLAEREGIPVNIGEEYQADVPLRPFADNERKANPPIVASRQVFSLRACGGDSSVDRFLDRMNAQARQYRGFDLAPFSVEVALEQLTACKGNEIQAAQRVKERLPEGPYFPGLQHSFNYDELCSFVRALEERGKDFEHISRCLLPERSTSELVWMYYTRHKQLRMQSSVGLSDDQFKDDNGETIKSFAISAERAIGALRGLAVFAGDGFPLDSRVQLSLAACRRGIMERERKRRLEESLKQTTRLRNRAD